MVAAHVYQVQYSRQGELDPGYDVLDNYANLRSDWYEYWPMREYLLGQALDENAFYGFLSPKFKLKTNLDATQVKSFIASCAPDTDVVLFSPSIHNSAFYWNVFEHGEAEHPGLYDLAEEFFARIGLVDALAGLVCDSRNTVYSNYIIAKPRFWRAWLAITEQLFAIAESDSDALGARLRAASAYRGGHATPMKIFLLERVASWLLCRDASFKAVVRDPFAARSRIYKLPLAVICDALKMAYVREGRGQYKDVFEWLRALRRPFVLQVRAGEILGLSTRHCLSRLKAYWSKRVG